MARKTIMVNEEVEKIVHALDKHIADIGYYIWNEGALVGSGVTITHRMFEMMKIPAELGNYAGLVLWVRFDGLPVSKNRRTLVGRGHVYTAPTAQKWMESVRDIVRLQRFGTVKRKERLALGVIVSAKNPETFDMDGALPCLVDAVMAGLADDAENFKRPPDHLVWRLYAGKEQHDLDMTEVCVLKLKDEKGG